MTLAGHARSSPSSAAVVGEVTPLLVAQTSDDALLTTSPPSQGAGQASVFETILNLAKTCMGTGCLALPFVCQQGGVVVFVLGSLGIAVWNVYSVERLCRCLDYIPREETSRRARRARQLAAGRETSFHRHSSNNDNDDDASCAEEKYNHVPPSGTPTLGVVAWFAFGKTGLQALDVMLLILFMGVVISYLVATTSFLGDTPLSLGATCDTILAASFMCLLSLVPDMGYLSRMSATGLSVLIAAFMVIALHGLFGKDDVSSSQSQNTNDDDGIRLWPSSVVGLSQWFGVAVFGYGVVPLAYNFRESMAEPQKMVGATMIALTGVALLYSGMGVGLLLLYRNVEGEMLHELGGGFVPVLTRLAMVWVVIFTTPLLILPCSELVEGKLNLHPDHDVVSMPLVFVRLGIVTVAGFIAVLLPGFVQVLSFVGCACVGLVGFCLPPILHMRLFLRFRSDAPHRSKKAILLLDGLMISWGIFATVVSSAYTFSKLVG